MSTQRKPCLLWIMALLVSTAYGQQVVPPVGDTTEQVWTGTGWVNAKERTRCLALKAENDIKTESNKRRFMLNCGSRMVSYSFYGLVDKAFAEQTAYEHVGDRERWERSHGIYSSGPSWEYVGDGVYEGNEIGGYNSGGDVHVRGYTRSNGTYVHPYTRAAPGHGSGHSGGHK